MFARLFSFQGLICFCLLVLKSFMVTKVFSTIHVQIFYLKIVAVNIAVQYSREMQEKGKHLDEMGGKYIKI
jgi:hypothetical protein